MSLFKKLVKLPQKNGYQVDEHTLHLPLEKVESLLNWIEINLLSYLNKKKYCCSFRFIK